jgi:hypothetical protein
MLLQLLLDNRLWFTLLSVNEFDVEVSLSNDVNSSFHVLSKDEMCSVINDISVEVNDCFVV